MNCAVTLPERSVLRKLSHAAVAGQVQPAPPPPSGHECDRLGAEPMELCLHRKGEQPLFLHPAGHGHGSELAG